MYEKFELGRYDMIELIGDTLFYRREGEFDDYYTRITSDKELIDSLIKFWDSPLADFLFNLETFSIFQFTNNMLKGKLQTAYNQLSRLEEMAEQGQKDQTYIKHLEKGQCYYKSHDMCACG